MYISANKVNVTHSYTPQQGSTSPSTAGQEEASGPLSSPKLKQNSLNERSRLHAEETEGGEQWESLTIVWFDRKKDEDLSISPKASLPPWQIGVSFKSQSPFLFLKNTMYKNKRKTIKVK